MTDCRGGKRAVPAASVKSITMSLAWEPNRMLSWGANVLVALRTGVNQAATGKMRVRAMFFGKELLIQPSWGVIEAIERCAEMFNAGLDPKKIARRATRAMASSGCPGCGSSEFIAFFIDGVNSARQPVREFVVVCKGCGGEICSDRVVTREDFLPKARPVGDASIHHPSALAAG